MSGGKFGLCPFINQVFQRKTQAIKMMNVSGQVGGQLDGLQQLVSGA